MGMLADVPTSHKVSALVMEDASHECLHPVTVLLHVVFTKHSLV